MPSPDWTCWLDLPKIELHLHVAGSVRPATMRAFVEADGLDAWLWKAYETAQIWEGLPAYLARFAAWDAAVGSPERLARVVAELCDDLAADGVIYAELRLRPPTDDDGRWDALVEAAVHAGQGSSSAVRIAFISVLQRGWSAERAQREARRAARWAGRGVVALDVVGDETRGGAEPLVEAMALARACGLGITAHAGEGAGPESVREALRLFEPSRIAHGVRAVEDPATVETLRERGVHLEMTLTSNVQTGCVQSVERHPFADLLRAGLSVSLSTDNRTISGTTLSREYARAADELWLSRADLACATRLAARAAFLPPTETAELVERIDRGWGPTP